MVHLTEEDLIRLSQIEDDLEICDDNDLKMMEHLKECEECYNNYAKMRMIYSVTGGLGFAILPEIFAWKKKSKIIDIIEKEHSFE